MEVVFETLAIDDRRDIIDILNYYVINSSFAFPDKTVPYDYYNKIIFVTKGYPAYSIKVGSRIVGFCFLHAYNPLPTFSECAEVTYFIDKEFTGKGIGKMALNKLETEALKRGINTLLANISSENLRSISFHEANGFNLCGRFEGVLKKKGKRYDIIWMQKQIE